MNELKLNFDIVLNIIKTFYFQRLFTSVYNIYSFQYISISFQSKKHF